MPVFSLVNVLIIDLDQHGQINTPGNGSWELTLSTARLDGVDSTATYISFLPNGSVDTSRTTETSLKFATNILSGAQSALHARTNVNVKMLEFVNWIFVSIYWTMLYDLGQISPTIYMPTDPPVPNDFIMFPPTNNIFRNPALFNTYYSYFNNTI